MGKYADYNIIPIGDHCAISGLLKELNLRLKSYPFDWVAIEDQIRDSNIIYNLQIIHKLNYCNVDDIVKEYIGNAFNNNNLNTDNKMLFPHDHEPNKNDTIEKYKRRFTRLQTDLNKKNIFVLLTRNYYIEQEIFENIIKQLLNYNNESIILFISGTNHTYFEVNTHPNVIFKYIYYGVDVNVSNIREKDIIFRNEIKTFLFNLLV